MKVVDVINSQADMFDEDVIKDIKTKVNNLMESRELFAW